MPAKPVRPAGVYLLVLGLLLLGVGALAGGFGLVGDPSGRAIGIPLSWLEHTPFSSFLIPGLILLVVLGIFPLFTALALWLRPQWRAMQALEYLTHEHWAWSASLTVGMAALIWIMVQFLMLGVRHPVQIGLEVFVAGLGLVIIALSLRPSVRHYCAR